MEPCGGKSFVVSPHPSHHDQVGGHSLLDLPFPAQRLVLRLGLVGARSLAVDARRDRNKHAEFAAHPDAHDLASGVAVVLFCFLVRNPSSLLNKSSFLWLFLSFYLGGYVYS